MLNCHLCKFILLRPCKSLVHGDLYLYWGGQRVIKIEVFSKNHYKRCQPVALQNERRLAGSCCMASRWVSCLDPSIASVMVNKGHHCPSMHGRVVSLSAAELPVVLCNALAKKCPPPCQVAPLFILLNKTEWKIQGLWDMGITCVKPPKFSTRTGWLCSKPLACWYICRPRDAVKHQEKCYIYSCSKFFRALKVHLGLDPRPVQGALR